jgi:tetratricopeptide (TPR) repeat protein
MLVSALVMLLIGSDVPIDRTARDCAGANLDQALSACSRIIDTVPHSEKQVALAYFYRGRAEYIRHQAQQSIADYSQAIAIEPRFAEALSERGSVYLGLNQIDFAIADCTEAIQINPNTPLIDTIAETRTGMAACLIKRLLSLMKLSDFSRSFPLPI